MNYEVPLTTRLKEDTYKYLKQLAEEDERSLNAEINYIIKKYYEMKKGN